MIRLCSIDDVPEGGVTRVEPDGHPAVAVYNLNGTFYATADTCTHAEASLSEGFVDGDVIECPLHGGAFRIPTGEVVDLPCRIPLESYPVTVEDGSVFADLT